MTDHHFWCNMRKLERKEKTLTPDFRSQKQSHASCWSDAYDIPWSLNLASLQSRRLIKSYNTHLFQSLLLKYHRSLSHSLSLSLCVSLSLLLALPRLLSLSWRLWLIMQFLQNDQWFVAHYCNWVMKDLELRGKMIYGSRVVLLVLASDLDVLTS